MAKIKMLKIAHKICQKVKEMGFEIVYKISQKVKENDDEK